MKKAIVLVLLAQSFIVFAEDPFVFQNVRSMGMGDIVSQNPALLSEIKQKIVTLNFSCQDYSGHWIYVGLPFNLYLSHIGFLISYTQSSLEISFSHWQRGDRREISREGSGGKDYKNLSYETFLLLGIGKQVLPTVSIGANIKYLKSDHGIYVFDPHQVASCDIGISFNPVFWIEILSTLYNGVSSKIEYAIYDDGGYAITQELPRNLTLGVNFSPSNKIMIGIQISHLLEEKIKCEEISDFYEFHRTLNLGGEFTPVNWLSLRVGLIKARVCSYRNAEGYHYVDRNIPTVGLGYRYKHIEIDFAGIFDNREKDLEEVNSNAGAVNVDVSSTFRYMLSLGWEF